MSRVWVSIGAAFVAGFLSGAYAVQQAAASEPPVENHSAVYEDLLTVCLNGGDFMVFNRIVQCVTTDVR